MIDSIRLRLALWHLLILALLQIGLCLGVYLFLTRHVVHQSDRVLQAVTQSVASSFAKDFEAHPGQPVDATTASRVLNSIVHIESAIVILDDAGTIVAVRPQGAAQLTPLPLSLPTKGKSSYYTYPGAPEGEPGPRRIETTAIPLPSAKGMYYLCTSSSIESPLAELHTARLAFAITIPILLTLTGLGGWWLTGRSFAPANAMSLRARQIDAEDLNQRIVVENGRDELGQLASSFNQLLDRVSAASARERQFMADAAHELRTPISVIQTATTVVLSSNGRTSDEYKFALETIDIYAKRLSRNIDDVFRLARADAGFKSIGQHGLYLDEVIHEAVRAGTVLASRKDIQIKTESMPEALFHGDEALLGEMVLNLLENAVKYTRPGGCVEVVLQVTPEHYLIEVSDNGVGISAAQQAHIFDRFYRAEPAVDDQSGRAEGSGLGLPIALWIAKSHQGTIELKKSNQAGTTFQVALPRA